MAAALREGSGSGAVTLLGSAGPECARSRGPSGTALLSALGMTADCVLVEDGMLEVEARGGGGGMKVNGVAVLSLLLMIGALGVLPGKMYVPVLELVSFLAATMAAAAAAVVYDTVRSKCPY